MQVGYGGRRRRLDRMGGGGGWIGWEEEEVG